MNRIILHHPASLQREGHWTNVNNCYKLCLPPGHFVVHPPSSADIGTKEAPPFLLPGAWPCQWPQANNQGISIFDYKNKTAQQTARGCRHCSCCCHMQRHCRSGVEWRGANEGGRLSNTDRQCLDCLLSLQEICYE